MLKAGFHPESDVNREGFYKYATKPFMEPLEFGLKYRAAPYASAKRIETEKMETNHEDGEVEHQSDDAMEGILSDGGDNANTTETSSSGVLSKGDWRRMRE